MDTLVTQRYSKVDLFSINGRTGRSYYFFYSAVIYLISLWSMAYLILQLGTTALGSSKSLTIVATIGLISLLALIFLTIQRCHDFDKSAWFSIFAALPFISAIYAITLSTNGLNRYGELPEPTPTYLVIANVILVALFIISAIYLFPIFYEYILFISKNTPLMNFLLLK